MPPRLEGRTLTLDAIVEGTFRSPVSIEELQATEIDAFVQIVKAGIESLPFANPEQATKRTHAYYQEALQNDQFTLLAAKDEQGSIIGALEAEHDNMAGRIYWVVTEPRMQQQGVASALYSRYEAILGEKGVPYMLAAVDDANRPSLDFHRKRGFYMNDPYMRLPGKNSSVYYKEVKRR